MVDVIRVTIINKNALIYNNYKIRILQEYLHIYNIFLCIFIIYYVVIICTKVI